MARLKCPKCKQKGNTGLVGQPGVDIEVRPGNMPGSTKSMLRCVRCEGVFLRGPLPPAKIIDPSAWPYPTD